MNSRKKSSIQCKFSAASRNPHISNLLAARVAGAADGYGEMDRDIVRLIEINEPYWWRPCGVTWDAVPERSW